MFQHFINYFASIDLETVKAWGPIIVGLAGIVFSFIISFRVLRLQDRQNENQNRVNIRQLELAKSKEERDEILNKLNSFYGPFKELRTQSRILYGKFAPGMQAESKNKGPRFRTLRYLLEGNQFANQDAEILTQILQINHELAKLIENHSGVVDKPELQDLLGKLGAHIRILQLASERKLSGPASAFEDIVFPSAIDGAIESAILRLQDRLSELRNNDQYAKRAKEPDERRSPTVCFYDENADEYAQQTMFLNLTHLYDRFREHLQRGARILDAGCGVGRDTRYFIENGYIVISFDPSREMVRKCREYPHAYCIKLSFDEMQFKEEFDGVWACASILHLKSKQAKQAVIGLTNALKPGGALFISLKEGKGSCEDRGRYFEYYGEDEVQELYQQELRLERIAFWKSPSGENNGGEKSQWLNLLLRRKPLGS